MLVLLESHSASIVRDLLTNYVMFLLCGVISTVIQIRIFSGHYHYIFTSLLNLLIVTVNLLLYCESFSLGGV